MIRALALLRSFARSTWHGLRGSPTTAALGTATIALCLLLAGAFALLVSNMDRLLTGFGEEIRVSAYLDDGLDDAARAALAERVRRAPGVEGVEIVTKAEALERFRASASGRAGLLDGLSENPLPASLEIHLEPAQRTREGVARLVAALEGVPGISDLGYGAEWVEGYGRAVGLIRAIGIGIGGVLGLATLLIVANTIRLSVYARRDELEILSLVGASRSFVATPFVLEGLLQGCVGGLLALLLLYVAYLGFLPGLSGGLELILGYAKPAFLGPEGSIGLVAAGAALGALGSSFALLRMEIGA